MTIGNVDPNKPPQNVSAGDCRTATDAVEFTADEEEKEEEEEDEEEEEEEEEEDSSTVPTSDNLS
jgi:hypothetical protein